MREPTGAGDERGPVPPVRAFLLLGAIAIVVPLTILATRPEPAPTKPAATGSPDYSLTDEEAIAEFERLNAQLMAAYRERNIALAESIFTSDSPMLPRVRKEINELLESGVISRTRFEEVATEVQTNGAAHIQIERVEVLRPRFLTERGSNANAGTQAEKRVLEWEIRLAAGAWRLYDAVVVERKNLRNGGRS
jgi:hypothetical protein